MAALENLLGPAFKFHAYQLNNKCEPKARYYRGQDPYPDRPSALQIANPAQVSKDDTDD